MKKFVLLSLSGVALFAFIFSTSILWYYFFSNSNFHNKESTIGSLEIQLADDENTINEINLIPLSDEEALKLKPYTFKVINNGKNKNRYNVLIEDAIISDDLSYSNKELLKRNELRYQLSMNGKIIRIGNLADIKNNILDSRYIDSDNTNNYELIVYLAETLNDSWRNKYYHYNISIQMEDLK